MSESGARGVGGLGVGRAGDLAPRWTPDVPLAERITRVGRFRRLDPSRPGSVWSTARWVALVGYVAVVGWAFARARRLAEQQDGPTRTEADEEERP